MENAIVKNRGGRPSIRTPEMIDTILLRLAGGESLTGILKTKGMPTLQSFMNWLSVDTDLQRRYSEARVIQVETLAEEIIDISDNGTNDWMQLNDPDNPGYALNGEHIQRARLRVDTRKWFVAKMLPKKYGDRQILAGDKDAPLSPTVNLIIHQASDNQSGITS